MGVRPIDWKSRVLGARAARATLGVLWSVLPSVVLAQAASPFSTGASSLETNILAILTPVAIILVMVLGVLAMANRISWAWAVSALVGVAIVFGAPQIVTWIRGMFGV